MDLRIMGLESSPLLSKLQQMMEMSGDKSSSASLNGLSRTYVRDAKAMAATPADVTEYPNSYVLVVDMPGLKSGDIMVQVEDDNVQWREEEGGRERRDQVLEDGELKEERERGKKQKREEGD